MYRDTSLVPLLPTVAHRCPSKRGSSRVRPLPTVAHPPLTGGGTGSGRPPAGEVGSSPTVAADREAVRASRAEPHPWPLR